ncbi:MAG: 2-oxo acid dehydrogenase subunit E2 [Verrucomicrobiota bacterium]|nr:2-oxo acid dehydrogenase subunit E2 [Verrucomicrobiota bacterium]
MDVKLPNLGEGADSGVVVNLFVKEGDVIALGQAILELENEKAVASIPSTAAGAVSAIFVKPGDRVSVGQKMISVNAGAQPAAHQAASRQAAPAQQAKAQAKPASREPQAEAAPAAEAPPEEAGFLNAAPAAAPSVRRVARELGIDLRRIRGSESGGRIVMGDLRDYIQRLIAQASRPAAGKAAAPRPEPVDFAQWGPVVRRPLSPLRQVIARRMAESWLAVPRVTQFDEADFTRLNGLRKKHAAAGRGSGVKLTLTPLVIKAVVETLKKHPAFNSSLDEAANEIVTREYFHIGVAVDTEQGLMAPVIRDADKKSLPDLAAELESLAQKARDRKIAAEEMRGGTFTISNQGAIGSGHFTPIVNTPEAAILGLGRGALKPVVRDGKIEARLMTPLALSYDHRVIDGAAAARFMVDLVNALENFPEEAL